MVNKRFDFYGEDTWKVNSRAHRQLRRASGPHRLVVRQERLISVFNPAAYIATAPCHRILRHAGPRHQPGAFNISGRKPLSFQFAPSAGFAIDLDGHGNTILRGGAGTNYYVDPGINAYSAVGAPPNLKVFSYYTIGSAYSAYALQRLSHRSRHESRRRLRQRRPQRSRPPVTYSWNLALSHIFPAAIHVETSYVGNTTRHLNGYSATNLVPLGSRPPQRWRPILRRQLLSATAPPLSVLRRHRHQHAQPGLQLPLTPGDCLAQQGVVQRVADLHLSARRSAYNCEDAFDHQNCYSIDAVRPLAGDQLLLLPHPARRQRQAPGQPQGRQWPAWTAGRSPASSSTARALRSLMSPQGGANHNEYGGNQVIGIYGSYPRPGPPTTTPHRIHQQRLSHRHAGRGGRATSSPATREGPEGAPVLQSEPASPLPTRATTEPSGCPYIHGPAYFNDEMGIFKEFKIHDSAAGDSCQAFDFLNRSFDNYQQYDATCTWASRPLGRRAARTQPRAGERPARAPVIAAISSRRSITSSTRRFLRARGAWRSVPAYRFPIVVLQSLISMLSTAAGEFVHAIRNL